MTKRSGRRKKQPGKSVVFNKEQEVLRKRVVDMVKMKKLGEVQKLVKDEVTVEPWGRDAQVKVCIFLEFRVCSVILYTSILQFLK